MSITQLLRDLLPHARFHPNSHFSLYFSRECAEDWLLEWTMLPMNKNAPINSYRRYQSRTPFLVTIDTGTYQFIRIRYVRYAEYEGKVPPEYEFAEEMSYEDYNKWLEEQ